VAKGKIKESPMKKLIAAVSAGVYEKTPVLDLNYPEDRDATVDFNVVMTEDLEFVEVQGAGEEATFSREEMNAMLDLSEAGIKEIVELQKKAIADAESAKPEDLQGLADAFK
jgi:ribonuclease PH